MRIPIDRIIPDPNQPRKTFDDEVIKQLASSFENYGVITPLKVRLCGDNQYMVITGELRYRAAKARGDKDIEVGDPISATDQQAREMQFIENLQRQDVPPLELGEALLNYRNKYKVSQQQLSSIIGLSQTVISGYEEVCTSLTVTVQKHLQSGRLTFDNAVHIASIKNEARQNEVADIVVKRGLGGRTIRQIVTISNAEPERPIIDIVDAVVSGIAKEEEMARIEAAKKALGMPLETPEDLERAAEALKKEARRKAEEAMTPERKAALEAEKQAELEAQAAAKARRQQETKERKAEEERRRRERAKTKARAELKGDRVFVQEALKAMPQEERLEMLGLVPSLEKPKQPKGLSEQFQEVIKDASQLVGKIEKLRADPGFHQLDLKAFALDLYMLTAAFTELSQQIGGNHE